MSIEFVLTDEADIRRMAWPARMRAKYLVWLLGLGFLIGALATWQIAVPASSGSHLPKYEPGGHEK